MTIHMDLSVRSINMAISRLREAEQNIRWGLSETIDMLTQEGAEIAQAADGSMANVIGYMPDENTGLIVATGEAPVIAEFGAGDYTLDPANYFSGSPNVPVYPGSYSELVGTGEYYTTGKWHFGGKVYHYVMPRQGLYHAKEHILQNAVKMACEVIKL